MPDWCPVSCMVCFMLSSNGPFCSRARQQSENEIEIRRCGMTVIHEPHNLGSNHSDRPDLFMPLTGTADDITILYAYASANVSGFQKMHAQPFDAEKMKSTNDMTSV